MSHHPIGLQLDDLTPKQLRQILRGTVELSMLRGKRTTKGELADDDEDKETDDLVDLHREQSGDSNSPKVLKDDLPKGVTMPEEEEEEEEAGTVAEGKDKKGAKA